MSRVLTGLTIIVTAGAILGGAYTYDQSIVKAADMLVVREQIKLLYQKFDDEKVIRRIQVIQERLWVLEDRYINTPMPQSVKEEKRKLEKELKKLEEK